MGKSQQIIVKDNVPLKLIFPVSFSSGKSNKNTCLPMKMIKKETVYIHTLFLKNEKMR